MRRPSELANLRGITNQHVETRSKAIYPMDEQGKMNGRSPGQDIPGRWTLAQVTICPWHDAGQHREEAAD